MNDDRGVLAVNVAAVIVVVVENLDAIGRRDADERITAIAATTLLIQN